MIQIEYKGRLFGDVLKDMIYAASEDAHSFVMVTGVSNVMLSNFMNHKRYPGIKSLRKIAMVLPTDQRGAFVLYFHSSKVKAEAVNRLKESGIRQPYSYSTYDKQVSFTGMYEEGNEDTLKRLELQGLFKYLTAQEKVFFKNAMIEYIVERNQALVKADKKMTQVRGSAHIK